MSYRCGGAGCTEWVYAPGWACSVCWDYRVVLRDQLPSAWVATHALLVPGAGRRDESLGHISLSRTGSSAPLRMDALNALELAVGLVVYWTDVLAADDHVNALPAAARDGFLVERGVAMLQAADHHLGATARAAHYVCALTRIHQRFRRVADPASSPLHLHIACPSCGRLTLVQRNADAHVQCLTCGAAWSEALWSAVGGSVQLAGRHPSPKRRA